MASSLHGGNLNKKHCIQWPNTSQSEPGPCYGAFCSCGQDVCSAGWSKPTWWSRSTIHAINFYAVYVTMFAQRVRPCNNAPLTFIAYINVSKAFAHSTTLIFKKSCNSHHDSSRDCTGYRASHNVRESICVSLLCIPAQSESAKLWKWSHIWFSRSVPTCPTSITPCLTLRNTSIDDNNHVWRE